MGNLCRAREHSIQFLCSFLHSYTAQFNLRVYGAHNASHLVRSTTLYITHLFQIQCTQCSFSVTWRFPASQGGPKRERPKFLCPVSLPRVATAQIHRYNFWLRSQSSHPLSLHYRHVFQLLIHLKETILRFSAAAGDVSILQSAHTVSETHQPPTQYVMAVLFFWGDEGVRVPLHILWI
jgi:hypothetical protein